MAAIGAVFGLRLTPCIPFANSESWSLERDFAPLPVTPPPWHCPQARSRSTQTAFLYSPSGAELATSDQLLPAARHAALVSIGRIAADAGSRCSRCREGGVARVGIDSENMDIQTGASCGLWHMADFACVRRSNRICLRCSGSVWMSEGRQIFLIDMAFGAFFLDRHRRPANRQGHCLGTRQTLVRTFRVNLDDRGLVDIVAGGATALGAIIVLEATLVQTAIGDRYLIIGAAEQSMRAVEDLFAHQMAAEIGCAGANRICSGLVGSVRISEGGSTIKSRAFPIGRPEMALGTEGGRVCTPRHSRCMRCCEMLCCIMASLALDAVQYPGACRYLPQRS